MDGGAAGSLGSTDGNAGAPASDDSGCVAATRLDQCCESPVAISRALLDSDPCWAEWHFVGPYFEQNPECPNDCAGASCPPFSITSRAVGRDSTGACAFVSECMTADDCGVFYDGTFSCCDCGDAYPRSLAASAACLVAPGTNPPAPCEDCSGGRCAACPAPVIACKSGSDGIARCVKDQISSVPSGRCAAEQPCPSDSASAGCGVVCHAPGEEDCTATPFPGDCTADADCAHHGPTAICAAAHCGNPRCVAGCTTDASCGAAQACGADHHCIAKTSCASDGDCGLNHRCVDGNCVRLACELSLDCDTPNGTCFDGSCGSICVNGTCYETPGTCDDVCSR